MSTVSAPIEVENTKLIILVANLDRAVQFYHDVLGFHTGLRKDDWCEMHHAGTIIGLRSGEDNPTRRTGLAIQVPDIQAACCQISHSGGAIIAAPQRQDALGIYCGAVTDTEGNEIMITQIIDN